MSCADSAIVNAPIEKVRRQCAQPGFLARMIPGITGLRRVADGLFSCGLDFDGMPATARVRVERDGNPARLICDEPRCAITVEFVEQQRRTAIGIRVDLTPGSSKQHAEVERALRDTLKRLRSYLDTEPGVPAPRQGRRDPLLHTGSRIPPDTFRPFRGRSAEEHRG